MLQYLVKHVTFAIISFNSLTGQNINMSVSNNLCPFTCMYYSSIIDSPIYFLWSKPW